MFAPIVSSKYPHKARELWTYQAIMIGEARRYRGRGWSLYNAAFRQQITSYEVENFAKINQSLYSTTFLVYGVRGAVLPDLHSIRPLARRLCIAPMQECPSSQDGTRDNAKRRASKERRGKERKGLIKTAMLCMEQWEVCAPLLLLRAYLLTMFWSSQEGCLQGHRQDR